MIYAYRFLSIALLSCTLTACGGGSVVINPPDQNSKTITADFNANEDGWKAGFADYPAGQENFYELSAGFATLPTSLGQNLKGLKQNGNNHSDDLFMYITKKYTGFLPNTRYNIDFELSFASNAKSGCSGIGGAPGEGVTIKAGATKSEPSAVNNGAGFFLMNIDKGNQVIGGSDAIAIGNFANGRDCASSDDSYAKKTVKNTTGSFTTFSSADGSLWILFGTDSGFEGTTTIYYMNAKIVATKI